MKKLTVLVLLLASVVALPIFAQTYELKNPLKAQTFTELIDNILRFIFNVALVLTPLMVVIGGFMFLTAGGKPEQLVRARAILIWTAIGFGVILFSRGLVAVLKSILGV